MPNRVWIWVVVVIVGLVVILGTLRSCEQRDVKPTEKTLSGPYAFLLIGSSGGRSFSQSSPGFPGHEFPNKEELATKPGAPESTLVTRDKILGTVGNIRIWGDNPDVIAEWANMAFDRIEDLGADLSLYNPKSELWAVNRAAGQDAVPVSEHMMTVLKRALLVAELSDGTFDPTVGPLVAIWRETMMTGRLPDPARLDAARALVDYKFVQLNEAAHTVKLTKPGMMLDLSAIAKGYLADEGARFLDSQGAKAATVELGGDIACLGKKPDGSLYRIIIENPFNPGGNPVGIVEGSSFGVVTSGNYRQFVVINGERYSHLIDPKTGNAVPGAASCTVTGPDAMTSDALATAICIMGDRRGQVLIQKMNRWYQEHPPKR